jgi:hypothetical protein
MYDVLIVTIYLNQVQLLTRSKGYYCALVRAQVRAWQLPALVLIPQFLTAGIVYLGSLCTYSVGRERTIEGRE